MTLTLYNTLTGTKQAFAPQDPSNVRLYVCGPTVYDFAHIGNARPVIVFDVLFRLLRHLYGAPHVTYVRNITDVDDKINARAAAENISIGELTETTLRQFREDISALGVLMPTVEPRATESIPEMIALIEMLLVRGSAYVADAHVLFDVTSMKDYGALSRRSLDEMIAGARVEVAPYKKNPMDFVLWKPSSADLPGWDSPWGRGRPGWHIECSAMSWKYLGETFDIHGGGIDLVFPHHENELAQSRCALSTPLMAQVWMHNGFLQVEGRKMAKSEGNFTTIRELLGDWPGEVLRFSMLRTHYRQPIDWTAESLATSSNEWDEITLAALEHDLDEDTEPDKEFVSALGNDLNTPAAKLRLHELMEMAKKGDHQAGRSLRATLSWYGFASVDNVELTLPSHLPGSPVEQFATILKNLREHVTIQELEKHLRRELKEAPARQGMLSGDTLTYTATFSSGVRVMDLKRLEPEKIEKLKRLKDERSLARKAKDFSKADEIRLEIERYGFVSEDTKSGTRLKPKK